MKNKKELAASRNEYLKAKKEKKKAKWAEIEKEVGLEKLFDKKFIEIYCFAGGKGEGQVAEFQ